MRIALGVAALVVAFVIYNLLDSSALGLLLALPFALFGGFCLINTPSRSRG